MTDFAILAWADQMGALLRDKIRAMQDALVVTGWDSMAHVFTDPSDGGRYRLVYEGGDYYVQNLDDDAAVVVVLDLELLGVPR